MGAPTQNKKTYDVVVVGAGASGVGLAVTLKDAGIENFLVLERDTIGASFDRWPNETCFITPSFPTNSIGMLDLNAVALGTSPAVSLKVEHPTGKEYAFYLRAVAKHFELPISEQTDVRQITKTGEHFQIETGGKTIQARHVVWAAGEFQYPLLSGFDGIEHCRHTATISSYEELEGDDFIVIGGYESGMDVAYNLAMRDKTVRLFDKGAPWEEKDSDPSISLSPYTFERICVQEFFDRVTVFPNQSITSVKLVDGVYEVVTHDGGRFHTSTPPLFAGGFEGSHKLVENLFEKRKDGFPLLTRNDESTSTPGAFLCGPAVRHGKNIFCFIYKYRQRFAVVAKAIANAMGLAAADLEAYRQWGMYLDDLSICGEDCVC